MIQFLKRKLERKLIRPKEITRKGKVKIVTEINKLENGQTIKKINDIKSWFLENVNKVDKPLVRLIKERKKTQIIKIRDKRGHIRWIVETIHLYNDLTP